MNTKKILVVGFYEEETMAWYLERNLLKMGFAVEHFCYRSFSRKISPSSLLSKGFRHAPLLKSIYSHKMNHELIQKVQDLKPDLVIVLKGETIFPSTIRKIKDENCKVVNWFMDPIVTLDTDFLFDSIKEYDDFMVKDKFIEMRLRELGFDNVRFLSECYDPAVYKKMKLAQEDISKYGADISHVGNIYPYRLRLLKSLTGHDLKVWGALVHVKRSDVEQFYQGNRAISFEKAKIFNAAKIVFNSHHLYEVRGVNVRTFEIAGCGAFQLVDFTEYVDEVFKIGKEIICYRDANELKELVAYYLENKEERGKIANASLKRALKEHTYEKRIAELFKTIGFSEY